jgi:LmbE family N-acetylglucosaminyl deacetylase
MITESTTPSPARPTTTWGALPAAATVLAVTARPGQESAELGGSLLAFRQAGARLSLLCLTRGEAAAPNSGTGRLEAVRPWEVQLAASILGVRDVGVANYRDGGLHRYRTADLTERIGRAIGQYEPDLLLVIAPEAGDSGDGAVARAATAAAERAGLPVVGRTRPGVRGAWTVSLGDNAEITRAVQHSAVAAHASQSQLLPTVLERLDLLEDVETLRWLLFPHGAPAQRAASRYVSSLPLGSPSSVTMCSAMAIDAVAAGDGAFLTEVTGPTWLIRKSSTRPPSGSTAWARTPAGALVTSPGAIHGRYVLASAR